VIFRNDISSYLSGKDFSSGIKIRYYHHDEKLLGRNDFLKGIVKNKNIIHVGFVDHIPLIKKKIDSKKWLHSILTDSSKKCIGVDINEDGVNYVKKEFGIDNVITVDLIKDRVPGILKKDHWNIIILADVIEHINSPVEFLEQIRKKYSPLCDSMLITTPNAFKLGNIINIFKNSEIINSDHRFWFTPYTLAKIAVASGLKITMFTLVQHGSLPKKNIFKKYLLNKYPLLRDTIAMEFKF